MKSLKKYLAFALVSILILSALTGCGNGNKGDSTKFDTVREINVLTREDGSGTRGAFIELLLSLLFAVPVGIGAAIYLTEYARRGNKLVHIVGITTETLSGIPSIVYGLFGSLFFVKYLRLGLSLLSGALTLSIMILPLIMRTTEEALRSVPDSYCEGSFGLGDENQVSKKIKPLNEIDHNNPLSNEGFGSDMLSLCRNLQLQEILTKALHGEQGENTIWLHGKSYQINADPITSENIVKGAVLFFFNVTEKEKAEQIRREFTANVTHELKTPFH